MTLRNWIKTLTRRLFFHWRYLGSPSWDTGTTPPELYAFILSHPPGRALDLGCGTGTNAITLAVAGWDVIGIDFVGSAIAAGHKKASQTGVNVDLRQGDVTHLKNIQGRFDLVLDIGCFHSLSVEGKIAYVRQLGELLAPQGTYLLYGFYHDPERGESGLKTSDLELLSQRLDCVERVDGTDRRDRRSAWFTYRLKP